MPVGTHNCLICEANGNCRLQDLAYFYKITKLQFKEKELSDIYPTEDDKSFHRPRFQPLHSLRALRAGL